jgi:hypothetical protein
MKKIVLMLILALGFISLFAQSGLFDLAYAMPRTEADSLLVSKGFISKDSTDTMVRYFPEDNNYVDAIIVFVEPKSDRIIGWFIKYSPETTANNDQFIIQTISNMHGEKNHYDEDTDQLIWFLSTTRTVHVVYADDGGLTVLYFDAYFSHLFDLKSTQDINPETKD